ncbi:hypothetical protein [Halapricum desulfuricans]|uniref:DUF6199 domain-containing protein n=1 Tax=Halapricum desulfuricans TaxID=2841257 RepID=A0A897N7C9_9EURY|nr:hypothetical protein [Halapricum desulfuricans]QSG08617.1 Uncharacterized protein HSR122_1219 [Halapricum desulfuricans]
MLRKARRAGYGLLALSGVLHALAPRLSLRLAARTWLTGFENTEDVEPKDWFATAMRAAGVGMAAAGLAGFRLERPSTEGRTDDEQPAEVGHESPE